MRSRLRFWWRYLRRSAPWDTGIVPPEIVALADRLPAGTALDIGCGTGTTSIYLAQRGWRVTGIDFIAMAIRRASQKAAAANVKVAFHVADITRLDFLHDPFDLVIDIGCLHNLTPEQQTAYSLTLTRLTRPGANFALYAFGPRLLRGRQVGLTSEDVAGRFRPSFQVESDVQGQDMGSGAVSGWYILRRLEDSAGKQ